MGDAGSCIADFVFRQKLSKRAALPRAIHLRFLLPHVTHQRGRRSIPTARGRNEFRDVERRAPRPRTAGRRPPPPGHGSIEVVRGEFLGRKRAPLVLGGELPRLRTPPPPRRPRQSWRLLQPFGGVERSFHLAAEYDVLRAAPVQRVIVDATACRRSREHAVKLSQDSVGEEAENARGRWQLVPGLAPRITCRTSHNASTCK